MTVSSLFYQLLIGPIEILYQYIYGFAANILNNYGLAIIVLSLAMNFLLLPLYNRADAIQDEERAAEKNGGVKSQADLPANAFGCSATPQKPVPKVVLDGFTALIVDDVPINLKVLGAMLKGFHINLVQANSGADALAKLPDARPDLVLTDMWMPGMSGEELAREIRATPDGERVVVMAVTADVENQNNFDMSVFEGILLKPVTKTSLAFAFQEMIDKGRIAPKS